MQSGGRGLRAYMGHQWQTLKSNGFTRLERKSVMTGCDSVQNEGAEICLCGNYAQQSRIRQEKNSEQKYTLAVSS